MPENNQTDEFNPFEVEITDLDVPQHAKSRRRARLERLLLRWQRAEYRRARLWLSGVMLACLALMLVGTLFNPLAGVRALLAAHWPFQSSSMPLAAQGAIPAQVFLQDSNQINCPVQAAWSPNSSQIAVLGYTQSCSQGSYVPAQVDLYNVETMRQIVHWQPDAAIFEALQTAPDVPLNIRALASHKPTLASSHKGNEVPAVQYLQMLWSPDGSRLALQFSITGRFMPYEGLFLASLYGGQTQVLFQPEATQAGSVQRGPLEWDVQKSVAVPINPLSPALTYTWGAQDSLVPQAPLNAQADLSAYTPLAPGNPSGARTFSIWQPGYLQRLSLKHEPHVYLWSSDFAAWSPDGRYVVTDIAFTGLMEPPGQSFPLAEVLTTSGLQNLPRLPAHDPALLSAAANAQAVAWNPAGTVLAVYNRAGVIDLYDCQSGQLVRSLTPAQSDPLAGSAILLSWSPDGHSLLLSSAQWGLITLWDNQSLQLG